jgi:hypothetical protein
MASRIDHYICIPQKVYKAKIYCGPKCLSGKNVRLDKIITSPVHIV